MIASGNDIAEQGIALLTCDGFLNYCQNSGLASEDDDSCDTDTLTL